MRLSLLYWTNLLNSRSTSIDFDELRRNIVADDPEETKAFGVGAVEVVAGG